MEPDQRWLSVTFDKRTRGFIKKLESVKTQAAAEGIELTPEEVSKLALSKALSSKKVKRSKNKKSRGGWPFLPGSFESGSR